MADKRCTAASRAPLTCEAEWTRRRRELEDMPMRRIDARPPASDCCCRAQGCGCGELSDLLTRQNQLLYELLAAVNGLTAVRLAAGQLP